MKMLNYEMLLRNCQFSPQNQVEVTGNWTGHCHRWIRQSWSLDSPKTCQRTHIARDGQVYIGKSMKIQSLLHNFRIYLQLEKNSLALKSKKLAAMPLS